MSNQNVAVCTQPANTNTQPCSPLATLATSTSTTSGGANPLTTDSNGNFFFYAAPGTYTVQIYGPQVSTPFVQPDTVLPITSPATGDVFFKSGRPWYDVMAFGAKNDGVTDDTVAVQAAITAACTSTQGPGATIFFPPGKTTSAAYFFGGTTSPIVVTCDNLAFQGVSVPSYIFSSSGIGNSILYAPALVNTAIITTSGTRYGLSVKNLSFKGHGASPANIQGINITANAVIKENNFYNFGGAAITAAAAASASLTLEDNIVVGCLLGQTGGGVDIGCISLASADTQARKNYVSQGLTATIGQLGTGHRYAWLISGGTGFFDSNMAEQSEHGFLNTGSFNTYINNRTFQNQGNGFVNRGSVATYIGNRALDNGQNANNTFAGFDTNGTGSNSLYAGNECGQNGGTGVFQSNCFNDSNSNGGTQNVVENLYANNRAPSNGIAGVKYNFTGTVAPRVVEGQNPSADNGDTSPTFQCWLNSDTQYFNTVLTANRTLTLSATGAWNGCKVRVIRTANATGAFTLTVNGLALYPGNSADFEYIAGGWKTVGPNDALTVASGTKALPTASVTTATCDAGTAATANGTLSTDTVDWSFNAAPTATNKYGAFLVVYAVPSTNTVTFYTCNPSATTSTPTAMTVNWSVRRP